MDLGPLGIPPTRLLASTPNTSQVDPTMGDWAGFAIAVSVTLLIGRFVFGY